MVDLVITKRASELTVDDNLYLTERGYAARIERIEETAAGYRIHIAGLIETYDVNTDTQVAVTLRPTAT